MQENARIAQNDATSGLSGSPETAQHSHPATAETITQVSIEDLLWRMRGGDREAAAEFLERYGARIRRRVRGKLGPSIRRLFDSMDILSTLGRRLDLYVMAGRLQAANEAQLWELLFKMADNALVDKVRIFKTTSAVEHEDSDFTRQQAHRTQEAALESIQSSDVDLTYCMSIVEHPLDRQILSMWLADATFVEIGRTLHLTEEAVRKRFGRVQTLLKYRLRSIYQ